MIALVLLSPTGYEEIRVPEDQLEAGIGSRVFGWNAAFYRSGWLYAGEGFRFLVAGHEVTSPLAVKKATDVVLEGPDGSAALAIRTAPAGEDSCALRGADAFSIGRASANDLVYKDPLVSVCHGRFSKDGEGSLIYTDMSTNGSYVDGAYLKGGRKKLSPGAEVLIPPLMRIRAEGDTLTYTVVDGLKNSRLTERVGGDEA